MKPLAIIAAALLPLAASPVMAQETCKLKALGTVEAATVREGRTLALADGREVRLVGIEAADGGRAALQDLVRGRPLRLEGVSTEPDRYGRLVAFAYAGDDGGPSRGGSARPRAGAGRQQGLRRHPSGA